MKNIIAGCCYVVPVLYQGPFSSEKIDEIATRLRETGSVAAPGFMDPEGVVIYLAAARQYFKFTLDGDGHKTAAPQAEAA